MKPLNQLSKSIRRIIIRSTNWIGDAIMTTPAVRAIRKQFPHAHITLLAKPWVVPVFEHSPHVDDIMIYDEKTCHKGLKGKINLIGDIRSHRFDTAILLQNAIEAAILAFCSGINRRVGFNTDARGMLLTHSVPISKTIKSFHQTRYYVSMLESAGIQNAGLELELFIGHSDRLAAYHFLKRLNPSKDIQWIGMNPSATYGTAKQWFPKRFAQLADRIAKEHHAGILIFGGPKDKPLGEKVCEMMHAKAINLAGKTTLGMAMALIQQCQVFVTNDSGLMHIACALKTPLIAIFGSTNPITTGPIGENTHVVQVKVSCSPCLLTHCPKKHHICMDAVDVNMVFQKVEALL
ncbi:MAG: heptosyltransferase II [Candidatus Magnetoglobus multicellularis str. Araruama]|uniref:lipopolysaccharide heptosyltransferase II n=1 Tax=Candidatus Magnetoglobus multicellularis str. Araruama TaxID=890399 RepID=A0A1V1P4Y1_9BACT|nr:MAG: heptosyltransferase II [Candidatus Magnetoglobus multicellularis str. Araruama]